MLPTTSMLDRAFILSMAVEQNVTKLLGLSKEIVPLKVAKKERGKNKNCCDTWKKFVNEDEECRMVFGARVGF